MIIVLVVLFLCWGSFLNVVGHRLITGTSVITPRSACPHCHHTLAWYDLIPVLSFIMLKAHCRYCRQPISWLYPGIEIITASILTYMVYHIPAAYWLGYGAFFSALIVSIRTDLQDLVISRFVSLYAIPLGVIASWLHLVDTSWQSSILGATFGYAILWSIATIFKRITGKEGMGSGDFELLGFIGSVIGVVGIMPTLLIASLTGASIGILLISMSYITRETKVPFGPFLALGAMIHVFFPTLTNMLL